MLLRRVLLKAPVRAFSKDKVLRRVLRTLSFLSLFFFWRKAGKTHQKSKDFLSLPNPPKSLEKKGKTLKKTRNSSQGEKTGNSKKQGKEGQGRERFIEGA